MNDKIVLELTENEAESLLEFIAMDFLAGLVTSEADNLTYVCNICKIYTTIKKALEGQ